MEKRLYFVIGDLLANVFAATVAVVGTAWLMGGSWGMSAGMVIGMVIGMTIASLLSLVLLVPLLGAMEVFTPCMLSGMLGGMWGGMWPLDGTGILRWGMSTGLAVFALVYALNAVMSGPQKVER